MVRKNEMLIIKEGKVSMCFEVMAGNGNERVRMKKTRVG